MEHRNKRHGDGSATTDTAKSTRASRQRSHRKFRGLTCASCRTRKVRCEGSQPTCKTCELYHVECRYDKPPPLSQVVAMARRLQEAESMIEQLQGDSSMASMAGPRSSTGDGVLEDGPTHSPVPVLGDDPTDVHVPLRLLPTDLSCEDVVIASPAQQSLSQPSARASRNHTSLVAAPEESLSNDLSLDENGKICYYGPTSAVHQPVDLDSPSAHSSSGNGRRDDVRSYLTSHAQESAIWEEFALGNAAIQTGISRGVMARLLHLHWTWVAPMFMWVYRPAFVRDMTTGGRYYSEFLLLVLCAHASRYQDSHHSELLSSRVRLLLGDAIQKPSSIPTVQALLQLSARELAHGSISQAWLYSGMAFRMAGDLGLQHTGPDIAGLKGLSPVDLEIRRRLFWSCYFWDKAMSLYTGRLPAVTELPQNPVDFNDTAESDTWSPYYEDSSALTRLAPGQYPSMKSHAVSCFANSCKLSVIINDIIVQIYSRRSRLITEGALQNITRCLDAWRAESPSHLRYDPDYLPTICPPPHIISQNILYFATVILAHRPFWPAPAYYQVCIRAAQGMEKLLLLLESTFGFDNITYLMGYCIYTGASAILEDAKSNQGTAHPTMQTFLRALNGGMRKCPLLERSLHIIIKGLKRASEHRAVPSVSTNIDAATFATNSYIPAFPYFDTMSPNNMDMDVYLNSMNMDTMATLDCYPELQIDLDNLMGHGPA